MSSSLSVKSLRPKGSSVGRFTLSAFIIVASSFAGALAATPARITVYATSEAGSDASIKINECIAAVIAGGGGTCDATGLGGVQFISEQINVGDTSGDPVTLLVPTNANWGVGITDGVSCGVMVYNNSSIISFDIGTGRTANISADASSVNVSGIVCTDSSGGANSNSFRIEGIEFHNINHGTMRDAVAVLRGCKDNSVFRSNSVVNPFGVGLHVGGTIANAGCTVLSVEDTWVNGSNGSTSNATAQPVLIQGSSTAGTTSSVRFFGGSIVQPGAGLNNVLIDGGASFYVQSVSFYGVHMEGTINSSDGGTPMVRISHAGPVDWIGGTAYQSVKNGAYCFRMENSANSLQVIGVECGSSTGHLIQNAVTGFNLINATMPNINFYTDGANYSFGH